jgi:hypothetical protein
VVTLRITAPNIAGIVGRLALRPYRVEGDAAHFEVSRAAFDDLARQIEDAIAFLRRHKSDVDDLMALPSSSGFLDFRAAERHATDPFGRLSPELVCLAGKAGLGLELSHDPAGSDRPK